MTETKYQKTRVKAYTDVFRACGLNMFDYYVSSVFDDMGGVFVPRTQASHPQLAEALGMGSDRTQQNAKIRCFSRFLA